MGVSSVISHKLTNKINFEVNADIQCNETEELYQYALHRVAVIRFTIDHMSKSELEMIAGPLTDECIQFINFIRIRQDDLYKDYRALYNDFLDDLNEVCEQLKQLGLEIIEICQK